MANGLPLLPQEAISRTLARYAKTDSRYWKSKVFKPVVVIDGSRREVPHYSVRMQWQGRRHSFPLRTGNLESAITTASRIYKSLQVIGWDATLAEFSPSKGKPEPVSAVTVGQFIEAAKAVADTASLTFANYVRCFRRIVAGVEGIGDDTQDGKKPGAGRSKYDYRRGGRAAWVAKVDAVKLSRITPEKVQRWKIAFVNRALGDPLKERAAKVTANSTMRQAKGLFSRRKILSHLASLKLPAVLPFDGVEMYPRQSMRYASKIDAGAILRAAEVELAPSRPEEWKALLLALGAGLRRKEIDLLMWSQVDFERQVIRIETTEHFRPKSADSVGEVEIDLEMVAMLRGYRALAKGAFVIEGDGVPRPAAGYSAVRAKRVFDGLYAWLRGKGMEERRPLHTLRKEFGSIICNQAGLYAASRALRHADVQVTTMHYLDRKERVTLGLGGLLRPANVTDITDAASKRGHRKSEAKRKTP